MCKIDPSACSALESYGGNLNAEKLSGLLSVLDKLPICAGQPDDCFVRMISAKRGKIFSING